MAVVFVAYPFVVYFGLRHGALWQVVAVVVVLALLRLSQLGTVRVAPFRPALAAGAVMLIVLALLSVLLDQQAWLKGYPILMSLLFLAVFAASLGGRTSIIEQLAALRESDIDAAKRRYMRRLTVVWCGFFMLNATLSALSAWWLDLRGWALYNGLISYLLMGSLLVGEWVWRHWVVIPRMARAD